MSKKIPTSRLQRVGRLIGLSTSVLAKEVKARVTEKFSGTTKIQDRINQAEDIVKTLGDLKGAAMKAGQLLSMEFSDFLPPEVIKVLRKLHDQSVSYDGVSMANLVRSELGEERFSHLESFSLEPVAAASIGQVHRALLRSKSVVIKIQYPGIAASIDHDISIIKRMVNSLLMLNGKSINLSAFYDELHQGLKDEADYLREAGSLRRYRELFHGEDFIVPEVEQTYSTNRILTMSEVTGTRLSDWIADNKHKPAARIWLGRKVMRLLIDEFFGHGIVQTDPNFGNFLIDEPAGKMVLLDCGAVRIFPKEFRRNIRELATIATDFEVAPVIAKMVALGMVHQHELPEVKILLAELIIDTMALFTKEQQPVNFGDIDFINDMRRRVFDIIRMIKHSGPARQVIFLNRKLGGMFHLLKEMQVEMDIYPFWEEVLAIDLSEPPGPA